jgi:carboxypeptidase Q
VRNLSIPAVLTVGFGLAVTAAQQDEGSAVLERILDEGLRRSQAQTLYLTLTDRIGARLTGSPAHVAAAQWARERLSAWGLANARLEPFPFGRGWSLEQISVEMTAPRYMRLTAYADAWTPSIDGILTGRAVYVGDRTAAQIGGMMRELEGAIVLTHLPQTAFIDVDRPQPGLDDQPVRTGNPAIPPVRSTTPSGELLPLLQRSGARAMLKPSAYRDGTVGVVGNRNTPSDAVPSITLAAEQYNMMARLTAAGEAVALRIELRTRYHEEDLDSYNVLAEIPGADPARRDEIVLVGAHLDSWHAASGATDNADGVAAVMEAMRILTAIGAQPRRTIRVALWSGEEQGLLGARAYVARHYGTEAARERLSVYLNDDPGSGRTLGFYMEGNAAAKAIFDRWLAPLEALGATRNVIEGIGSTDHVPFTEVGLPAFTAVKAFDAYDVRTRHTNTDFPDRTTEDDLRQSAIVLAPFAWQAATTPERVPRAPRTIAGGRQP